VIGHIWTCHSICDTQFKQDEFFKDNSKQNIVVPAKVASTWCRSRLAATPRHTSRCLKWQCPTRPSFSQTLVFELTRDTVWVEHQALINVNAPRKVMFHDPPSVLPSTTCGTATNVVKSEELSIDAVSHVHPVRNPKFLYYQDEFATHVISKVTKPGITTGEETVQSDTTLH
jgi:hypothetical protein